jgi:hypothetical protein
MNKTEAFRFICDLYDGAKYRHIQCDTESFRTAKPKAQIKEVYSQITSENERN